MNVSMLIAPAIVFLLAPSISAQSSAPAAMQASASVADEMSQAEVRKVDKAARKVALKHGPIKNLDMPPMTMVFQVRDEKLFDKLVAGETIKFSAEQSQGAYVVTAVEPMHAK